MSGSLDTTQILNFSGHELSPEDDLVQRLEKLNAIGASLSAERDINRLLEAILTAAKSITRADGGTLYRVSDDQTLRFEILRTSSLKYYLGGTTGNAVPFYPIQLYQDGKPNHNMVAAYAALTGKTVNIADAYTAEGFDFSGTLNADERQIINHHIVATVRMLEALPWPRHLKNVPEYAGGHHERMDGKGYPKGLTREQMSVQARVMGIADIFEALTAKDRPYKRGKTLSESLEILGRFKENGHIDPDLFDIFVRKKIYLRYAEMFLDKEQIDAVDESKIPGFVP